MNGKDAPPVALDDPLARFLWTPAQVKVIKAPKPAPKPEVK